MPHKWNSKGSLAKKCACVRDLWTLVCVIAAGMAVALCTDLACPYRQSVWHQESCTGDGDPKRFPSFFSLGKFARLAGLGSSPFLRGELRPHQPDDCARGGAGIAPLFFSVC
jgi:hypothetical protein